MARLLLLLLLLAIVAVAALPFVVVAATAVVSEFVRAFVCFHLVCGSAAPAIHSPVKGRDPYF